MRFWSCSQFRDVIKILISKYEMVGALIFVINCGPFLLKNIGSYGGISLLFDKWVSDRKVSAPRP